MLTNKEIDRFWNKVRKGPGCWEWTAGRFTRGYGALSYGNHRPGYAHRFSYELHKGPVPDGMVVMHRCDNRKCVNPDHLVAGSQMENIHDAIAKDRWMTDTRLKYLYSDENLDKLYETNVA